MILENERLLSEETRLASMTFVGANQIQARCAVEKCYLMREPDQESDIITYISKGTFVVVTNEKKYNGYVKSEFGGSTGYFYSVVLDFNKQDEKLPEKTAIAPMMDSNSSINDYPAPTSKNHTIQEGPLGGQYYINKNGKKTYLKKKK
jgi:hypothetical protein